MSTTLAELDSSRIKRRKKYPSRKERRLWRITDRISRIAEGQECLYPVTSILRNEEHRFHCENGPAIQWSDGLKAYFLEGVRFEYEIWKGLVDNTLDAKTAISIPNLSQRRYAIKRIGYAQIVEDLNFREVAREGTYRIIEGLLDDDQGRFARILKVKCPSTGFDYFIRIPPDAKNIRQALAWTFNLNDGSIRFGNDSTIYAPEVET